MGNLFRDKIGGMEAIRFIQTRQRVQEEAFAYIQEKLAEYEIETRGVYIQDVVYPQQLVTVLTEREVAHQQVETFKMQRQAQDQRIETEKARGTAEMQVDLAKAKVGVDIQINKTEARMKEAQGEAAFIQQTGAAKGAEVRAVGLANAEAYRETGGSAGQRAHGPGERHQGAGGGQRRVHAQDPGGGRREQSRGPGEPGNDADGQADTGAPGPGSVSPAAGEPGPAGAGRKA